MMRASRLLIMVIFVLGLFVSFLMLPSNLHAEEKKGKDIETTVSLEDIKLLARVLEIVKQNYIEPVSESDLIRYAIKGMLEHLDPHSAFLDERDTEDILIRTQGKYGGLGMQVTSERGFVKIIAPFDESPAKKAGIQAGDLITHVDGKPVQGLALNEAVAKMRGKLGSYVELTLFRENYDDNPIVLKIKREEIKIASVSVKVLDEHYLYVRVAQFAETTGAEIVKKATKILSDKNLSIKGLVLDVRNNPGGRLDAAIDVVDLFLESGVIVSVKGRNSQKEMIESASSGGIFKDLNTVVLQNKGSASASEIVAGALQDHGRAAVVGTKSFGKGSVQTLRPLQENVALKLTTALYYTPSGHSIQAQGIEPDIWVDNNVNFEKNTNRWKAISENDLNGHLENPENLAGKKGISIVLDDQMNDFQLFQALTTLKAMSALENLSPNVKQPTIKKTQEVKK